MITDARHDSTANAFHITVSQEGILMCAYSTCSNKVDCLKYQQDCWCINSLQNGAWDSADKGACVYEGCITSSDGTW